MLQLGERCEPRGLLIIEIPHPNPYDPSLVYRDRALIVLDGDIGYRVYFCFLKEKNTVRIGEIEIADARIWRENPFLDQP
ncbi:MAG: hypothetical protein JO036_13830 [Candidatus Eremiobacteraeota bacterium]|nr:hypothetical protein [Candidatus Eremiobacteraeota bacterium]